MKPRTSRTHVLGGLALIVLAAGATLAGCPQPNGYRAVPVVPQADYDVMLGMHWIPGDTEHAVIVTKSGVIWRVNTVDPAEEPTVYLDIQDRLIPRPNGEEGLLGLAFAPDYASSGTFYVHYTALGDYPIRGDGQARKGVISRFIADGAAADPSTEHILLEQRQPYTNHNGGALAFGPDGYLYVAFGDGGSAGDPEGNGQNLKSLLGKILRLDVSGVDYTVPPDNPFVATPGARTEVWAYGLRNPWRIAFDPATGALWAADVGQGEVEEIDIIVKGGNYGWNRLEASRCYNADTCDASGTIAPVAEYTHEFGCAVTGGYVYHSATLPELQGWYVFGDFCSGRVWGVNAERPGAIIPLADTGLQITSFAEAPDGELYLVTFNNSVQQLVRK